mgnify:CR=1 FL=1|jgi:hypothetical protein
MTCGQLWDNSAAIRPVDEPTIVCTRSQYQPVSRCCDQMVAARDQVLFTASAGGDQGPIRGQLPLARGRAQAGADQTAIRPAPVAQ